jgi:triosephosphate isomerase
VAEAIAGSGIALGAQDCHTAESGAHTGDMSAAMLADVGCSHVIVGHSERRGDHGEGDSEVQAKARAALGAGLVPVVCVGESEEQRVAGEALEVIARQIEGSLPEGEAGLVVAYEPIWAIGTGRTATPEDVAEVHAHIRALLCRRLGEADGGAVRVLYGGSVKAANAAGLLAVPDVDGALVGGASLSVEDFWGICASCP